jgi:hypothetical protein
MPTVLHPGDQSDAGEDDLRQSSRARPYWWLIVVIADGVAINERTGG